MKEKKRTIKSNLKALDAMSNSDIDYSDIPELDEEFFKHAKLVEPEKKQSLTVR